MLFWTAGSDSPGPTICTTSWKGLVVQNKVNTLRTYLNISSVGVFFVSIFSTLDSRIEHVRLRTNVLHQIVRISSNCEVYRSAWRATYQEFYAGFKHTFKSIHGVRALERAMQGYIRRFEELCKAM